MRMKTQTRLHPFLPLIVILALTVSASAQIILNADFEAPAIADGTRSSTTPSSWSGGFLVMNPNSAGGMAGESSLWPQAQSGQQYEDIGNTTSTALSQTFTNASADMYIFTWYDNTALNRPTRVQTAPYSISVLDSSQQPVFSTTFDSYHATGDWGFRAVTNALTPGTYTLRFTSLNLPNTSDTVIDNVAVQRVSQGTSVPASIYNAVEIVWFATNGNTFQVQSTLSMENPGWADFGQPVVGDGTEKSVFGKARDTIKRFYRVIQVE